MSENFGQMSKVISCSLAESRSQLNTMNLVNATYEYTVVGALDPICLRSVFIANLSENVVRPTEIAASAVANFFLLITAWWSAASSRRIC